MMKKTLGNKNHIKTAMYKKKILSSKGEVIREQFIIFP